MHRMSPDGSDEEEDQQKCPWFLELLKSNPWEVEHSPTALYTNWCDWVLLSPLFPCIPQLSSLEYHFIEEFDSNETTIVMKVSTKINSVEKLAVLKLYQDPTNDIYKNTMLDGFCMEYVAYSHLTHFGLCDEGLVPRCYGWYDFNSELQDGAAVLAKRYPSLSRIWVSDVPSRALLLEYLEDTENPSPENYTHEMAQSVVDSLDRIHSIGIIHGDTEFRNILVRPDGRTFWIDFEHAHTFPPGALNSDYMKYCHYDEMSLVWTKMCCCLLWDHRRLLRPRKRDSSEKEIIATESPPGWVLTDAEAEWHPCASEQREGTELYNEADFYALRGRTYYNDYCGKQEEE